MRSFYERTVAVATVMAATSLKRFGIARFHESSVADGIKLYIHHQNRVLLPPTRRVAAWHGFARDAHPGAVFLFVSLIYEAWRGHKTQRDSHPALATWSLSPLLSPSVSPPFQSHRLHPRNATAK